MMKASAGGGGKGMRIARDEREVREGFEAARREALGAFGDDRVFADRFVERPRHIEIQVLGDQHGTILHLGERECSVQRRNQKVVEEAPSPFLDAETRAVMGRQAVALARAVGYHSAGTVEFVVDRDRRFYFLEMNTRLQVEHPVTEMVTGLDLVEQMIRVARGEPLGFAQSDVRTRGWAIEARVYAEDPGRGFLPSTGRLVRYRPPTDGAREGGATVRVDGGVFEGADVSVHYDPMVAKLCTHGPDRTTAIAAMGEALDDFELEGIGHNLSFLAAVMANGRFRAGDLSTAFIAEEFPEGFSGVRPDAAAMRTLAAVATLMDARIEARARTVSGATPPKGTSARERVVSFDGEDLALRIEPDGEDAHRVHFADGAEHRIASDWRPGRSHARFALDGEAIGVQTAMEAGAYRLRHRGMDVWVRVRSPRVAALARLMPPKRPPDASRHLLCPMPGVLTALLVAEGDAVEAGQALATVEAMKMENVLRAPRSGRIARLAALAGASLAVDAPILEFE